MSIPLVLLVTRHEAFASKVREQLSGGDAAVRILSPTEACESFRFPDRFPDVAFVDYDACTTGGSSLYQTIKVVLQGCRVVLVCESHHAAEAALAIRLQEAFDYLLIDSVFDPHRVSLLIERACKDRVQDSSDIPGSTKQQRRQILQALKELKSILKNRGDNPVVRLIDTFKPPSSVSSPTVNLFENRLAEAYHGSLVDLICGRLKRLENAILFSENDGAGFSAERTGTCVLVVEDDEICAEMARYILERHGYDVVVAATANDAKAALARHDPALVLMDVHLGETNGLCLIKAMRTGRKCHDLPVVVVSADRMQATVHHAAGLNVQGYLLKPYEPSLMVRTVKNALANSKHSLRVLKSG